MRFQNEMCAVGYLVILISMPVVCAYSADVCNPSDLLGSYAFQLSGTTTIAGTPKLTSGLGRLVFDGQGNLSGSVSAMFMGLLLGNPVTGTYEANADCTVSWRLQDDSGAYQHFSGTFSSNGARAQFKQSDPGGAQRGIMLKTSGTCATADLQKKYRVTIVGSVIPMNEAGISRTVAVSGTLDVDQSGAVQLTTTEGDSTTGDLQVESDCTVHVGLMLPAPGGGTATRAQLRGALVSGGKEILAIQTDPGAMITARFSSDSK